MTGRPELWDAGFFLLKERPVLGYGYDVEGKVFDDPRFYERARVLWSGSANVPLHNGYLSVAVGLGMVGTLLWLTVLLVPLWKTVRLPYSEHKAVILSIMVACLILNFSESIITGGRSLVAIIFWISWVMAERLSSAESAARHVRQAGPA